MRTILTFLLRLVFVAAGLVFAASLAVVFAAVLAVWALRAGWSKLTGSPTSPFVFRIDPRAGFDRMYRRAQADSPTPRADAVRPGQRISDVVDVEPREPRA
jgi:hypothetical protein